jgi:hypothetical protein
MIEAMIDELASSISQLQTSLIPTHPPAYADKPRNIKASE